MITLLILETRVPTGLADGPVVYLPGSPGGALLWPDRQWMAAWQEQEIVIWAVDAGEPGRAAAAVPAQMPGTMAWSPAGDALAYLQTEGDCFPRGATSVALLRLPSFDQKIILQSEAPSFGSLRWQADDELNLVGEDGGEWRFDLASRDLESRPAP